MSYKTYNLAAQFRIRQFLNKVEIKWKTKQINWNKWNNKFLNLPLFRDTFSDNVIAMRAISKEPYLQTTEPKWNVQKWQSDGLRWLFGAVQRFSSLEKRWWLNTDLACFRGYLRPSWRSQHLIQRISNQNCKAPFIWGATAVALYRTTDELDRY